VACYHLWNKRVRSNCCGVVSNFAQSLKQKLAHDFNRGCQVWDFLIKWFQPFPLTSAFFEFLIIDQILGLLFKTFHPYLVSKDRTFLVSCCIKNRWNGWDGFLVSFYPRLKSWAIFESWTINQWPLAFMILWIIPKSCGGTGLHWFNKALIT